MSSHRDLREVLVRPVRVEWKCPQTGCSGTMVYNGFSFAIPDGHHHTCNVCDHGRTDGDRQYPYIIYRDIEYGI